MRHLVLALMGIFLTCGSAFAQGNHITINGTGNTVTNNQSRSYEYHYNYSDNRSYTNSFNSHSGNTNSYNDSRSNYRNGNTALASPPVVAYRTPCGLPPSQCTCHRQPTCPPRQPDCTKLTYTSVEQDCWEWSDLCIRCWDRCGRYFTDSEGRRWNLSSTSSPVPADQRYTKLRGRLWKDSDGRLRFTAVWYCPISGKVIATRTFIDP